MAKRSIKDINAQLTALLNGDLKGGGGSGGGITVKTVVNSDHAGTVDPQEKVTLSFSPVLGDNERIVGVAAIQVLEDNGKPATFVITDVTINANSTQADITIMNALLVTQVLHSVTVGLIISSGSGGGGGGDITKTSQLINDGDGKSPFATQAWVEQHGGVVNITRSTPYNDITAAVNANKTIIINGSYLVLRETVINGEIRLAVMELAVTQPSGCTMLNIIEHRITNMEGEAMWNSVITPFASIDSTNVVASAEPDSGTKGSIGQFYSVYSYDSTTNAYAVASVWQCTQITKNGNINEYTWTKRW